MREHLYFVYMLASRRNCTLYTGVTNDVLRRTWQHKNDLVSGFTKKYGVHILAWLRSSRRHPRRDRAREADQEMESRLEDTTDREAQFRLE